MVVSSRGRGAGLSLAAPRGFGGASGCSVARIEGSPWEVSTAIDEVLHAGKSDRSAVDVRASGRHVT